MQAAGILRPPCCTAGAASTSRPSSISYVGIRHRGLHGRRLVGALPGQGVKTLWCRRSCDLGDRQVALQAAPEAQGPSGDLDPSIAGLPKRQLAAMALSPLAALSLPLVNDPTWQQSLAAFSEKLRGSLAQYEDQAANLVRQLDEQITYMDWTYGVTGIDLSAVWDPELWVRFKEAVAQNEPAIFLNKLLDRVQYKEALPQAGLVGDMRISYAKFLQLLRDQRIKRLVIYGDQRTAVAEVPHPWSASVTGHPATHPFYEDNNHMRVSLLTPNPAAPEDVTQWFCAEMPEWDMEKYRFYVDLPGDFWESGVLQQHMAATRGSAGPVWDPVSRQYILPYSAQKKVFQVTTEVQLLDPQESWDFLGWLVHPGRLEFYEKAACVALALRLLGIGIAVATGSPFFKLLSVSWGKLRGKGLKKGGKGGASAAPDPKKMSKQEKKESQWERLTSSRAREFMTKDAKTGKLRDTGVRFEDIAGMDFLVTEMKEVVRLLKGDEAYKKVGARCPKGIIFQGPPGTGKTYLARAIAGEAGVPFFSSVGSEFVEMFAGIAAARVNNLFYNARKKAPSIIFIDEIDAIGRARSSLGGDPGSMERESALLAMLVQMDGISNKTEMVLTIGATNLAEELDAALMRPGRFEVVYEVPQPGPVARLAILKYHSRNKTFEGGGEGGERVLMKVAAATQGWSAAALANLMNEAAILTVRRSVPAISLPLVMELVEGLNWGEKAPRIPDSQAKDRLALVTAAKAVAFALTPGLEPVKEVTLWSGRRGLGPSVEFIGDEERAQLQQHPQEVELMSFRTHYKTNAAPVGSEPLGEFLHVAGLLVPLYAGRALEVALYGREGASLATAQTLADCFELAYYCVRHSSAHPRYRRMPPLHTACWMGRDPDGRWRQDPLALGFEEELGYHKLTLTLLKAAWVRSLRLVVARRSAITRVAAEMLGAEGESISGSRLIEIIESTPLDPLEPPPAPSPASASSVSSTFPSPATTFPPPASTSTSTPASTTAAAAAAAAGGEVLAAAAGGPLSEEAVRALAAVKEAASDFLPILKEVLGQVPHIILTGEQQAGQLDEQGRPVGLSGSAGGGVSGRAAQTSFRVPGAGSMGMASFRGAPSPGPPPLELDDATLAAVSRAVMGRLDVVDLVGRNTAQEAAERVRDALLHPETRQRLLAVRRWVTAGVEGAAADSKEQQPQQEATAAAADAPFPPPPLDEVRAAEERFGGPMYGALALDLDWWVRRPPAQQLSWSAMELLFDERQRRYFAEDADLPRDEDTTQGRKRAAEAKAAAAAAVGGAGSEQQK
ncbi:hypothetical protein Agub_g1214 [Astrephomene gubernaculifera]|uniref:AAA+ ATPase domain-containing protein n=1 Tax=Astrephomene gubernaculifera TaxID=47775 RepID=A0AAD3DHQ8_9CHLO|nr:hypothetical protein Agub_g1214 [Astrephomene gubernaculifera]